MNKMKIGQFIYTTHYYQLILCYVCFTLVIALIGYGKLPGNLRIFTNSKSSMQPLISKNSLTIVRPFPSYDIGDIIAYHKLEGGRSLIITHRIYQIGGNVYVTKGDYNQAIDSEIVRPRLVIGKVILIIPFIGFFFALVKSPPGIIIFLLIPALLFIILELKHIRSFMRS